MKKKHNPLPKKKSNRLQKQTQPLSKSKKKTKSLQRKRNTNPVQRKQNTTPGKKTQPLAEKIKKKLGNKKKHNTLQEKKTLARKSTTPFEKKQSLGRNTILARRRNLYKKKAKLLHERKTFQEKSKTHCNKKTQLIR